MVPTVASRPSPAPFCRVPVFKCCDLGFHASLARTFRTYLSAEYNLETSRHEGLDVIENAVDNLDSRSDKHTVMDMYNQVFCPPLKFEFQPHMGDEVGFSQEPVLEAASVCAPRTPVGGDHQPRPTCRMLISEAWVKFLVPGLPSQGVSTNTLTLLMQVPHLQSCWTLVLLKTPPSYVWGNPRESHTCICSFRGSQEAGPHHSHSGQHPHQSTARPPMQEAHHPLSFLWRSGCSDPHYSLGNGIRHLPLAPKQHTSYSGFTKSLRHIAP